ncbi:MAG: membrane protein insertase YidC [Armatimonadetes bacterium]|nr:membrane protein insertase YidC [Armatimonadota bacterium]
MILLRRLRTWGLWLVVAMAALLPVLPASADELPDDTRALLTRVAEMRRGGKAADTVSILQEAAGKSRRDRVSHAAVQFVLADVYLHDLRDEKQAKGLYSQLGMVQGVGEVTIPGYDRPISIRQEAFRIQDSYNRHHWLYKVMAAIDGAISNNPISGRALSAHGGVLAILLLTILIKVAVTPLTISSFRSMREMQKVQPLMRELQQRYKDRPQELQKRTMELYREHGVNPAKGCLPMLLQMPIIILLWQAIARYQYPLSEESFLWIGSLANADTALAVIYAASLWASSKLTMMPAADPQQEQTQKMMAAMMPLMFFVLFKGYASGFILGWLFFNILTTAQQWHLNRGQAAAEGAAAPNPGGAINGNPGSGGGGSNGQRRLPASGPNGSGRKSAKLAAPRAIKRKRGAGPRSRGK